MITLILFSFEFNFFNDFYYILCFTRSNSLKTHPETKPSIELTLDINASSQRQPLIEKASNTVELTAEIDLNLRRK